MIKIKKENSTWEVVGETRGCNVYLDTDSLIELAKGCASRQQRFVNGLRSRGTLLFSWANAVEISGPQGKSANAVRALLDSIGPHWVPLRSNPLDVARAENDGLGAQSAFSDLFMEAYFMERIAEFSPQDGSLPEIQCGTFFQLGEVFDWLNKEREEIKGYCHSLDVEFEKFLQQGINENDGDPASLDKFLVPISWDTNQLAHFVLVHLQRLLIQEAKAYRFKPHDGLDFCHAVMAAAYGGIIALDGQWKRRVENLPCAKQLARTYYRPEIDQLVTDLEAFSAL